MSTPLNDPSGSGFYGTGFWGRKVFWLNVPVQWRRLDEFNYLQMLLNTWGDLGEDLLNHITLLPKQRDPYEVRTRETWTRWFYITESFKYEDDDKGTVVRLIGEKDFTEMPNTDAEDPPIPYPTSGLRVDIDAWEAEMAELFPWWPYEPLAEVGRYWQLFWRDAQYEVMNVRARNYDQPEIYDAETSLANELWVKGGDLTLVFDYITDRVWGRNLEDDTIQGTVQVGTADGSYSPKIEFPVLPVRIDNRYSPPDPISMDLFDSTVRLRIPMNGGGYAWVYDVPVDENTGTGEMTLTMPAPTLGLGGWTDDQSIRAKYSVQGYFMRFNAPPNIDYLAGDFGFKNDQNDPDAVQRSTIANITKFWGLKSTHKSYSIRGEISLFEVDMVGLYRIDQAAMALQLPEGTVFEINNVFYTDIQPFFVKFDNINADEKFWDYKTGTPTSLWVQLIDNMLIAANPSRWDGMTIGQAFAVDVTQGYYAPISEPNTNVRGPATVDSVAQTDQEDLDTYKIANGFTYQIRMKRVQWEAFNFMTEDGGFQKPEIFSLSEYTYNADPSLGVPPSPDDEFYYVDIEKADLGTWPSVGGTEHTTWVAATAYSVGDVVRPIGGSPAFAYVCVIGGTSGGFEPTWPSGIGNGVSDNGMYWRCVLETPTADRDEDVGLWTVIIAVGAGVVTPPILASADVAVKYLPTFDSMSCGYCRSNNMRAIVDVSDEAYDFYDSVNKVDLAIKRLKTKLLTLVPIHARIIEYEVTRRFEDEMFGVYVIPVSHEIESSVYSGSESMTVSIWLKGAGLMLFNVQFWDGAAWQTGYSSGTVAAGVDPNEWYEVVTDADVDLVGEEGMLLTAQCTVAGGEIRSVFKTTKLET